MVSLKDIAAECGVSVATVSKALNNHSDIGETTKKMIKSKAQEMGYHPNFSARALKTNRSYNLGVLYSDGSNSGLTHDYFAHVLESFKREAESKGYDITFLNNAMLGNERMSFLEHSLYRGMDGIMIANIDYKNEEVAQLLMSDLPVVVIDYVFNGRVSIMSDNINGMRMLLDYVYQKGHRKIAYVHGKDSLVTSNRLSSFYGFMEEKGLNVPEDYVKETQYRDTFEAGEATKELLDLSDPPTCILYPDDYAAIGGMNVIKNRGLRIPDDISIAGYDGIPIASHMDPQFTTYHQNTTEIGTLAADKLISLIEKPRSTIIMQYLVEGKLDVGKSVGTINRNV